MLSLSQGKILFATYPVLFFKLVQHFQNSVKCLSVTVKARAIGFKRSKRGAKCHTDGHMSKAIPIYNRL